MASSSNDSRQTPTRDINAVIGNMVLAHELIINDGFELKSFGENTDCRDRWHNFSSGGGRKSEGPSFEKTIQSIVHKAFWDNIEEQLNQEPPNYKGAFELLKEIKENLSAVLLPHHDAIRNEINQNLDLELIQQEVVNGCFNLYKAAQFIVETMLKICAPVRDEAIKAILERDGTVPVLRGIMEALDQMKLDMANLQLKSIKPLLVKQSVEYERGKFKEYLDANPDGLTITKAWLADGYRMLKKLLESKRSANDSHDTAHSEEILHVSSSLVLTEAYMLLLQWKENRLYPETLLMDEVRLNEISYTLDLLLLILSVILITTNSVASRLAADKEYLTSIKKSVSILLKGVPQSKLMEVMTTSVYEQVISETDKFLELRGFQAITEEQKKQLNGQLCAIMTEGNKVRMLLGSRLRDFVLLSMGSDQKLPVPTVFALMDNEISELTGQFARLVNHNKRVFDPTYEALIKEL